MFLTRLGENAKAVVTGDITQIDLQPRTASGLVSIREILHGIEGVRFVYLDENDVVRHPLVARIIGAYEDFHARQQEPSGENGEAAESSPPEPPA
jgi:phosphate starvation-inducible PhoH-like protein